MRAMRERLQKLLARAGVASRRKAESLIVAGAVRVNGRVVTELGAKADPAADRIEVEGRVLRFPEREVYLVLNKPRGVVTTAFDPEGRRTVMDFLGGVEQRVMPVGRLPYDAEGLLLVTSDGEFADAVQRGRLAQTFQVKVKGRLSEAEVAEVDRAVAARSRTGGGVRVVKAGANPWYEVTVREPSEDWLATVFFRLGHPVEKIRRVAVGSVREETLRPGESRELTRREVERLKEECRARSARRASRWKAG